MTVDGLDVSGLQRPGSIDWRAVAGAGVSWVMVRAAEGVTPDAAYAAHRDGARAAGLLTGGYQFARARHAPEQEADVFLDALGEDPYSLPPVLDLERGGAADQLPPAELLAWVRTWLARVAAVTGVRPWIYGGPGYLEPSLPTEHALGGFPLWCASYTSRPLLPHGWSSAVAWQFTGSGAVPGVPGSADRSVFFGSPADLQRLAGAPAG